MSDRDKAEMLRLLVRIQHQFTGGTTQWEKAYMEEAARLDTPSTPADELNRLAARIAQLEAERAAMREALWLTTTGTRVAMGLCDADQRAELAAWWSRGIDILARHPDITDVLRHDLPVETFAERGGDE